MKKITIKIEITDPELLAKYEQKNTGADELLTKFIEAPNDFVSVATKVELKIQE